MKSFKVPVKNTDEDFIITNDLWLTVGCQKGECTSMKKDNKNEFLFGVSEGHEAAELSSVAAGSTLSGTFRDLAGQNPKVGLIYVNSHDCKLSYSGKTPIQILLFRGGRKEIVHLADGGEWKTGDGDAVVGFSAKVSQSGLDLIEEIVRKSGHISYLLMQELSVSLATADPGCKPLFLINFSEHQSYAFPIKSSLKTVSLTIDMIKNKLVKHDLEKIWQVETVLHEALVNAITYGNDLDNSKNVEISYEMGKNGLRVMVKDKGTGFDVNNITVPVGTEALEKVNGRGIYIMQKFTDAIFFNEKGNELILFFNF